MYKWNGRVAIVTGASTSIGQSVCRALVEGGLTVCAIAKKTGVAKLDVRQFFDKRIRCENFLLINIFIGLKHHILRCERKNADIRVQHK